MEFCANQDKDHPNHHAGLQLHSGTVVYMAPGAQNECLHRVTGPPGPVPRLSMTWRTIVNHDKGCPLHVSQERKQLGGASNRGTRKKKPQVTPQLQWKPKGCTVEELPFKQFQ